MTFILLPPLSPKKTSTQGFSLIELMLYLALLALMLAAMAATFFSILDLQLFTEAKSVVSADANFITSRIRYDLDKSTAVGNPDNAGSESGSLALTIDGKNITYSLNGTTLEASGPDAATAISHLDTLVSDLNFKRLGSPSGKNTITVTMTLKSLIDENRGRPATTSVDVTYGLKE